mmetsp:Transcript_2397/g.5698  ORF Transcript_2397/g.5698 Transcript_2397/m.5698 type:complete len:256 (+) Transcript_2397:2573-3340(+)
MVRSGRHRRTDQTAQHGPSVLRHLSQHLAVELGANGGNGQSFNLNENAGDAVMRELRLQSASNRLAGPETRVDAPVCEAAQGVLAELSRKEGDKVLVVTLVTVCDDSNSVKCEDLEQRGLYCPEDDRIASDLDHEVAPPNNLQHSVRGNASSVSSAVHDCTRDRRERIRQESLRSHFGQVEVATCQQWAANVQFPCFVVGDGALLLVQDIHGRLAHGSPDRAELGEHGRVNVGQVHNSDLVCFGDGVHVEEPNMR